MSHRTTEEVDHAAERRGWEELEERAAEARIEKSLDDEIRDNRRRNASEGPDDAAWTSVFERTAEPDSQ